MSSLGVRALYEALRSINSATFTGAYQAIGTPLLHNPFLIKMVNNSTVPVTVSIDGIVDHDICPAGSFFLYDETANASREGGLTVAKGTQFWVKGAAGVGSVYLVVQYAGV
jgi:hypothetical protein